MQRLSRYEFVRACARVRASVRARAPVCTVPLMTLMVLMRRADVAKWVLESVASPTRHHRHIAHCTLHIACRQHIQENESSLDEASRDGQTDRAGRSGAGRGGRGEAVVTKRGWAGRAWAGRGGAGRGGAARDGAGRGMTARGGAGRGGAGRGGAGRGGARRGGAGQDWTGRDGAVDRLGGARRDKAN